MKEKLRESGIEAIGPLPWGTHFCHFFDTEKDLADILIPFFKEGLENNEYCLWIVYDPMTVQMAINLIESAFPDFRNYFKAGKIEILPHTDFYLKDGVFHSIRIINTIEKKLRDAIDTGMDGMRLNGNTSWLDHKGWDNFIEYEGALNKAIADKKLIVLCAYSLAKSSASDVLDVASVHDCAVTKRRGNWEILEMPEIKLSKAKIQQTNDELEARVSERTAELVALNKQLREEIEERRRSEEKLKKSEANLRTIFDNTDIAFVLMDNSLNIISANAKAHEGAELTFGTKLIEGQNLISLIADERKEEIRQWLQKPLDGESIHYENDYPQLDGSVIWYRINISPVFDTDKNVIGLCFASEDFTLHKLNEIEREKITVDLHQRNNDLEQFAYIVSHNLRAPLANILGISQILKSADISPKEKNEYEQHIFTAVEQLDVIIKDLNKILQVKQNISEKKEKVIFSQLVEELKNLTEKLIKKENAEIRTDFTQADEIDSFETYIYSIFFNLISNSIKFRQPDKNPVIEIKSEKNADKIRLTFKDNGRGIDLEKRGDQIFKLYKRFHPEIEGKGMGLYMIKTRVEILGGNISVKSIPGIGTEFVIELPL